MNQNKKIEPALQLTSAALDADRALRERARVRVPRHVRPFEHLARCRFLLPRADPLHRAVPPPPPAKRARTTGTDAADQTETKTTTSVGRANDDEAAADDDDDDGDRTSSSVAALRSTTLRAAMEPLQRGRFALLADARARAARVRVRLDAAQHWCSYSGRLLAFDRRRNLLLCDARARSAAGRERTVPQALLFGDHIVDIALAHTDD